MINILYNELITLLIMNYVLQYLNIPEYLYARVRPHKNKITEPCRRIDTLSNLCGDKRTGKNTGKPSGNLRENPRETLGKTNGKTHEARSVENVHKRSLFTDSAVQFNLNRVNIRRTVTVTVHRITNFTILCSGYSQLTVLIRKIRIM